MLGMIFKLMCVCVSALLALAHICASHSLLEAFTVFLLAVGLLAVASFEMLRLSALF
jgi:hypothetical protein